MKKSVNLDDLSVELGNVHMNGNGTQNNQKEFVEKYVDDSTGPYIAQVKYTNDPNRMGRLGVNIPALSNTNNPSAEQIVWCQYLSPFYGAKSINSVDPTDPISYKTSQHSYGMWAIPPDIDTNVLVIFAKGEKQKNSRRIHVSQENEDLAFVVQKTSL